MIEYNDAIAPDTTKVNEALSALVKRTDVMRDRISPNSPMPLISLLALLDITYTIFDLE